MAQFSVEIIRLPGSVLGGNQQLYYKKYRCNREATMPIATIDLLEGYDVTVKARLGQSVTASISGVIDAPSDAITVILRDMPACDYFRGGAPRQPAPALPDGAGRGRSYLDAMEARDLKAARSFLAPDFAITFPGGIRMTSLEELIAWSAPRYRFVKKTYGRFDAMGQLVYCFGTLHGEWPDGTAFAGIRFIDRFALSGGPCRPDGTDRRRDGRHPVPLGLQPDHRRGA